MSKLVWIGVRPARDLAMIAVDVAEVRLSRGLVGDRYGKVARKTTVNSGKREVSLIAAEAIATLATRLGIADACDLYPKARRNLVLEGVDLMALIGRRFYIGDIELEATGECEPCVRMNLAFGAGGFAAMQGLGGLTARVIQPGLLRIGDIVAHKT